MLFNLNLSVSFYLRDVSELSLPGLGETGTLKHAHAFSRLMFRPVLSAALGSYSVVNTRLCWTFRTAAGTGSILFIDGGAARTPLSRANF